MPPGPRCRKFTPYLLRGPGGVPLALRLSEGLGISFRGTPTDMYLRARHSDGRSALRDEQSRYSASAAPAKGFAGRCAPCTDASLLNSSL